MSTCNTVPGREALDKDCSSWPTTARQRWLEAFDPDAGSRDWCRESQYTYARVFTRYLTCVRRADLPVEPCALSPTGLRSFLAEVERSACPRTIEGYVHQLCEVASVIYADLVRAGHLDWLWKTRTKVKERARRTLKKRRQQVVPTAVLTRLARAAIHRGKAKGNFVLLRTGVFILLGVHMPERRRALAGLTIDMFDFDSAIVTLPARLQKNREAVRRTLPQDVLAVVQDYIASWRNRYAPDTTGALFVTTKGRPAGPEALRAAIVNLTEAELGVRVPPHLMRNAVATTVMKGGPENVSLAKAALGHTSAGMTKEYAEAGREARTGDQVDLFLQKAEKAARSGLRQRAAGAL